MTGPHTEIREALKTSLLHRPELDRDPDSFADFTGSGRCEPDCEGCAALAALATLEREAAERETALAENEAAHRALDDFDVSRTEPHFQSPYQLSGRIRSLRSRLVIEGNQRAGKLTDDLAAAEARVREVEAERDKAQGDACVKSEHGALLAVAAEADALIAALPRTDVHGGRLAEKLARLGAVRSAAALPAVDAPLLNERHYAIWDGCHDDPITVAEMRAVAANWRDTTQLANALDAAATEIERLAVDAPPQTREAAYMHERGGIFSTAVGLARLHLRDGEVQRAADTLDDACDRLHVLHFDACIADGFSVEAVERFLGPRDQKSMRSAPVDAPPEPTT